MERWEQSLFSFAKLKPNFPWETQVNVPIEDFDEAWHRRLLDKDYMKAWGVYVPPPRKEDRPGRKQYFLREDNNNLIGVVTFSRVSAEKTTFRVTTTAEKDELVWLCVATFILNYLADRNWDQMLEENVAAIEELMNVPKQITATSQESDSALSSLIQDDDKDTRRLGIQIKTTAVHYAHTKKNILQDAAASKMETSSRSYRKYRDRGWLLSDEEFEKVTGKTPADFWEKKPEL